MYVIFDIGGTNTRVALSPDGAVFEKPVKFKTPKRFGAGMRAIHRAVEKLLGGRKAVAAAGGIRGPLSEDKEKLLSEEVLKDWVGKPLLHELGHACGDVPVMLENDAALAALGEAHFGAGKGYRIVAYHTVSTGVGGARIVDGNVDTAHIGFEPGHQIIDADGTLSRRAEGADTLEELVSGAAIEKRFGKKPYEIPQSDAVWDELACWLSFGLRNTIMYWSPDAIVLGGSMILGDPRIYLADIVRYTEKVLDRLEPCPPIFDGHFRDDAGLYGALALLKGGGYGPDTSGRK